MSRRSAELALIIVACVLAVVLHAMDAVWWSGPAIFVAVMAILIARQEGLLRDVRRADEKYKMVVEAASHVIVTIAPTGHIVSYNMAAIDGSGYTRDDLIGRSFADFVAVDDVPAAGSFVARAFRGEETRFTLRFIRKGGEVRWLQGAVTPIRERGKVTGALVICRDVTEERSAEGRLRAIDQRFRTIVDTAFEGIWTIDLQSKTDYVNRRLADMLSYTPDEMLGRLVFDFVSPTDHAKAAAAIERQRNGVGQVFEIRLNRKDRTVIWTSISTSPLVDAAGAVSGALAMVTDITAQKRVEQELRDASQHLAAIVETQYQIAAAELDVPRVMQLIIQRTQALTHGGGAAIEIVEGDTMVYRAACGIATPLLGERVPMVGSLSGECVRTGEILHCADTETSELVSRTLAHRTGIRSILAVPLMHDRQALGVLEQVSSEPNFFSEHDADTLRLMAGVLSAALGHARAFAEKRELVNALQESQELFRTAFECSAVGMNITDLDGRYIRVNRALCELVGYSEEELRARRFHDLTHADDLEVSTSAVGRLLRGEINQFQTEKRYVRKDGSLVWVLLGVSVARDADGVPVHFVSQMVDITQRKRAESEWQKLQTQLAHSSKMQAVGQLVSGVAHELNNPLAAILGFSEILLQDCRDSETREALNIIFGQAQRSRAIVRDLLSFVRQREGRQRDQVDMRAMIDRVARTLKPAANTAGVRLEESLEDSYPAMTVDRAGLEQVLTNLVMNGVQAAGTGGVVRLAAVATADRVEIVVEDDGPGIAADVLPHIFEPFFTTKPVGQGTGLGLSVSLGIVEQHGGTLRGENRLASDGGGARFVVSIPISVMQPSDEDATIIAPKLPTLPESNGQPALPTLDQRHTVRRLVDRRSVPGLTTVAGKKSHVMVVDDEAPIRSALRRFFSRRGWEFTEATDGEQALSILLTSDGDRFDVIISDLKMPGVSGMDLYRTLAQKRPDLLGRLVFATGDVASNEASTFLQQTRCPVLEKPYELSLLAETVDRVRDATRAPLEV
jgi:PAS domain S-box-containing protein